MILRSASIFSRETRGGRRDLTLFLEDPVHAEPDADLVLARFDVNVAGAFPNPQQQKALHEFHHGLGPRDFLQLVPGELADVLDDHRVRDDAARKVAKLLLRLVLHLDGRFDVVGKGEDGAHGTAGKGLGLPNRQLIGGIRRGRRNGVTELVEQDDVVFSGKGFGQPLDHVALKEGPVEIHMGDADGIPPHSGQGCLLMRIHPHQMHQDRKRIVVIAPEESAGGVDSHDIARDEKFHETGVLIHGLIGWRGGCATGVDCSLIPPRPSSGFPGTISTCP